MKFLWNPNIVINYRLVTQLYCYHFQTHALFELGPSLSFLLWAEPITAIKHWAFGPLCEAPLSFSPLIPLPENQLIKID